MKPPESTEQHVRAAAWDRYRAQRILEVTTAALHRAIREARTGGALVDDLAEWTGYSRRRIFQILEP